MKVIEQIKDNIIKIKMIQRIVYFKILILEIKDEG